ncbi:MAG: hypothetical protein H6975_07440 [Gammaproteobacteria bacterium]|nr:hypothetical protein [Gammaproteobacteria bacterium]
MHILFKLFKFCFYLLILSVVFGLPALLWLMVEETPQVSKTDPLAVEDVERAKRLLRDLDPRQLKDGEARRLTLTERDASLLINQTLSRWPGATQIKMLTRFTPNHAQIKATLPLPDNPIGRYLNARVELMPGESGPLLTEVQIGRLSIPGSLCHWLIELASGYLKNRLTYQELQQVWATLSDIQIDSGAAAVTIRYDQDLARRLEAQGRDWVLPKTDRIRLGVYNDVLVAATRTLPRDSSLIYLLNPLFTRAAERTALGADPVEENRAVLVALALYLSGKNPTRILGERYDAPTPIHPTLAGRGDLAQHFAISAALAGVTDSHIANVIGVFKEVQDSQGGSGFSFADLTADRAGVRFAEQATASAHSARSVQQRVTALDVEAAIIPSITALPEGLQDPEFRRRFERRDSAAYNVIKDEIERRLDRCDFYRPTS